MSAKKSRGEGSVDLSTWADNALSKQRLAQSPPSSKVDPWRTQEVGGAEQKAAHQARSSGAHRHTFSFIEVSTPSQGRMLGSRVVELCSGAICMSAHLYARLPSYCSCKARSVL